MEGRKMEKETLTCPSNTPTSLNNALSNLSSTPKPIPTPPTEPSEESLTNSASPRKPCVCGFANTKTPAWGPDPRLVDTLKPA
ncbi:hypothetical protein CGBL_0104510 [Corynebacterium glutamicum]|nr:hypothetical protein CGBL_0104510 [Corynebacterium glutamicum]